MTHTPDHYLNLWTLSDPQPLATTATSHLYTVTWNGERVVLKILTDIGEEERAGAIALRYFDGQGAVRLLKADEGAHLLEYVAGNDLTHLVRAGRDNDATSIIGDVLNSLHSTGEKPLPELTSLNRWFAELYWKAEQDRSQGLNSVYQRAAALAAHLIGQERDVRVLHGDIHHENIRYHDSRGWLAFDPKGLVGERTYDAANTLCNPMGMPEITENETRILRVSGLLAEKMGIEHTRVLAFVFIYSCLSASWFLTVNVEPKHELTIAALVEPHIRHLSF